MPEDLESILLILAVSVPIGLLLGFALRKRRPAWLLTGARRAWKRRRWIFGGGLVLFLLLALFSFLRGRPYSGVYFLGFAALEAFVLVRYGSLKLSPEQEARLGEG